jgi:hypothetical protein
MVVSESMKIMEVEMDGSGWWWCGPHMSPIFIPYNPVKMQNKKYFYESTKNKNSNDEFFLYFSTTTINITYGGFTLHKYELRGA